MELANDANVMWTQMKKRLQCPKTFKLFFVSQLLVKCKSRGEIKQNREYSTEKKPTSKNSQTQPFRGLEL